MEKMTKRLTKAEEQVMQILWQLDRAFVKEIRAQMPEPKPAYSTISTVVRVLESKGCIKHETFGNTYRYYPILKKEDYTSFWLNSFVSNYFGGSFSRLASFFAEENDVDISDLEEMLHDIDDKLEKK